MTKESNFLRINIPQKVFSKKARKSSRKRPESLLGEDQKAVSKKTRRRFHRTEEGRLIEDPNVFSKKTGLSS